MWQAKKSLRWACAIRRGCSYHGLALNVDMDLEPFGRINPCGYEGLQVTSMARLLPDTRLNLDLIGRRLLAIVAERLQVQAAPVTRIPKKPGL